MPDKAPETDVQILNELRTARDRIVGQVGKVIIGQHDVIHELMIAMLSRGHCLLIGVPHYPVFWI